MTSWTRVLKKLDAIIARHQPHDLLFRGQTNADWPLIPSAGRMRISPTKENRLFNKFVYRGTHLFPSVESSWDVLFLMQHHGLPTRLLDWTETFAIAVYFALKDMKRGQDAAIWILDPYALNEKWYNHPVVCNVHDDFDFEYEKYFASARAEDNELFPTDVAAIFGSPKHTRMRSQRSYFTLHRDVRAPLDRIHPDVLDHIRISDSCFDDATRFIEHAGINEFAVFPDLDGLVRFINQEEFEKNRLYGGRDMSIDLQIRDFKPDGKVAKEIMSAFLREGLPQGYFRRGSFDESIEKNEVILIGRKVPVALAKKVISVAKRCAPFLRYVRHHERAERTILIGGKTDISLEKGSRPVSDAEFNTLVKTRLTAKQFHAMLDSFVTVQPCSD
jgi:FRG domain